MHLIKTKGGKFVFFLGIFIIFLGLIGIAIGPAIKVISWLWFPVLIITFTALFLRVPAGTAQNLLQNPLAKGMAIFSVLVLFYGYLFWIFWTNLDFLANWLGLSKLATMLVLSVFGLIAVSLPAAILRLFSPTGLPFDPKTVALGSLGLGIFLSILIIIRGVNVEGWGRRFQEDRNIFRRTEVSAVSKVIEVGAQWVEVRIPPRHFFDTYPESTVIIRLVDGRQFEQGKDQDISLGTIPGYSIFLRSKNGQPTKVVVSIWPVGR